MAISRNRCTNSVAVCILNICLSLHAKHAPTNDSLQSFFSDLFVEKAEKKVNMDNDMALNIFTVEDLGYSSW